MRWCFLEAEVREVNMFSSSLLVVLGGKVEMVGLLAGAFLGVGLRAGGDDLGVGLGLGSFGVGFGTGDFFKVGLGMGGFLGVVLGMAGLVGAGFFQGLAGVDFGAAGLEEVGFDFTVGFEDVFLTVGLDAWDVGVRAGAAV